VAFQSTPSDSFLMVDDICSLIVDFYST
jgi:hypothetical protein